MKIFNQRMKGERIAKLSAEIISNGGSPPMNCGGEPSATVSDLETILADCRARKAANPREPAFLACLSEKLTTPTPAAVKNAVQARLDAGKAMLAAAEAKATAKKAAAALKPVNALEAYQAMPTGPAKLAFLAANAVQIQQLAKQDSNK